MEAKGSLVTSLPKVKELVNAPGQHQDPAFFRLVTKIQKGWHEEGEADPGKIGETGK